jgi:hypothetical protein
LRTVKALPESIAPITLLSGKIAPSHLRVSLPDGTSAPILTLCNEDAPLMPGIYFGPTFGNGTHIRKMVKKGFIWADWIKSHPLEFYITTTTRNDVGHCYREQFQWVYFRCLFLLKVNCHIDLPWRLIPEQYQGLGMANYALVSLASYFLSSSSIGGSKLLIPMH